MLAQSKFDDEVARQRYHTLAELKSKMNLSWLKRKNYKVITDLDEFLEVVLPQLESHELLAVDTETTGLLVYNLSRENPLKDSLAGICISWERNQGVYLPLAHTQFKNLDKRIVLRKLRHILETHTIVCHNGLYDGKVFYDEGIRLNIKHDTLLLYFNIDSNVSRGSKGLKPLTESRYNYEVIEFEDIFYSSQDYGLFCYLPIDLVCAYACADSDHTLQLFMDSFQYLTAGQRRSYSLDIQTQMEVIRSEYCGKGVDMSLCRVMNGTNNQDLDTVSKIIYRYAHYLICKQKGLAWKEGQYKFKIGSSDDVAYLFHELLEYPVKKYNETTGKPSVDKFALKALLQDTDGTCDDYENLLLSEGSVSALGAAGLDWVKSGKDDVLIVPKLFKNYKYKLPYLISLWRKLEKFRTSFFAPLLENNFENKYFSGISLTRTQTARLIDPIQTMVGYLKRLIVPYDPEDSYLIDFDFAQIEYRVMVGLAGVTSIIDKLDDPESDYHREGGSLILSKAPEDITSAERGSIKSVNFGIPYGMSSKGIMENRYGIDLTKAEREKRLKEIEELLEKWNKGLWQVRDMLNLVRDTACRQLKAAEVPEPLRHSKISRIANPLGRTRVFYLDRHDKAELDKSDFASIRRQAGNYPIQSYAREIFCKAFIKLSQRLVKEGLMDIRVADDTMASGYRFENKVVIMAYIHDECLMNVSKEVNPHLMYRFIYEECMQRIPGHPGYYCGVNVIHNWYEGKSDIYEAPVGFVQEMRERVLNGTAPAYDPKVVQREWILAQIKDFVERRALKEVQKFLPDIETTHVIDTNRIVSAFKNYFIKPKMKDFFGLWRPIFDSDAPQIENYVKTQYKNSGEEYLGANYSDIANKLDDFTLALLETYCLYRYGEVTVVFPNGHSTSISAPNYRNNSKVAITFEKEATEDREAEMSDVWETEVGPIDNSSKFESDEDLAELQAAIDASKKDITSFFADLAVGCKTQQTLRL